MIALTIGDDGLTTYLTPQNRFLNFYLLSHLADQSLLVCWLLPVCWLLVMGFDFQKLFQGRQALHGDPVSLVSD